MNGLLITFEGPEGSGKSTQIRVLHDALVERGYPVIVTREPGGTPLGQDIRQWLLYRPLELDPWTELLLFLADRAQHLREVIKPALEAGKLVLSDRFIDSTVAYQSAGRGFAMEVVEKLHELTLNGLKPDLTILLKVDPDEGLRRAKHSKDVAQKDKFESQQLSFHQNVSARYDSLAQRESKRFLVFDTTHDDAKTVSQILLPIVLARIQALKDGKI